MIRIGYRVRRYTTGTRKKERLLRFFVVDFYTGFALKLESYIATDTDKYNHEEWGTWCKISISVFQYVPTHNVFR